MKRIFVFAVLAMVLVVSCAAQSAVADAQRIVGTWTVIEGCRYVPNGTVWVFNANGTGTGGGEAFSFGISAGGMIWFTGGGVQHVFFAPNGSRMIIGGRVFQRN